MLRSLMREGCVTPIMEYTFLREEGGGEQLFKRLCFPTPQIGDWTLDRFEQIQPLWVHPTSSGCPLELLKRVEATIEMCKEDL